MLRASLAETEAQPPTPIAAPLVDSVYDIDIDCLADIAFGLIARAPQAQAHPSLSALGADARTARARIAAVCPRRRSLSVSWSAMSSHGTSSACIRLSAKSLDGRQGLGTASLASCGSFTGGKKNYAWVDGHRCVSTASRAARFESPCIMGKTMGGEGRPPTELYECRMAAVPMTNIGRELTALKSEGKAGRATEPRGRLGREAAAVAIASCHSAREGVHPFNASAHRQ